MVKRRIRAAAINKRWKHRCSIEPGDNLRPGRTTSLRSRRKNLAQGKVSAASETLGIGVMNYLARFSGRQMVQGIVLSPAKAGLDIFLVLPRAVLRRLIEGFRLAYSLVKTVHPKLHLPTSRQQLAIPEASPDLT